MKNGSLKSCLNSFIIGLWEATRECSGHHWDHVNHVNFPLLVHKLILNLPSNYAIITGRLVLMIALNHQIYTKHVSRHFTLLVLVTIIIVKTFYRIHCLLKIYYSKLSNIILPKDGFVDNPPNFPTKLSLPMASKFWYCFCSLPSFNLRA